MAAIRAALVKGRSSGDEVYAAADESAQELKEQIRQLHQSQTQTASEGRTGISPARVTYSSFSFQPLSLRGFGQNVQMSNSIDVLCSPLIGIPCCCLQSQRHTQSIMPLPTEAGTP